MKEATGELNMTVVTIIAIGAIIALFWAMWPTITKTINETWGKTSITNSCPNGQYWNNGACVDF